MTQSLTDFWRPRTEFITLVLQSETSQPKLVMDRRIKFIWGF